MIANLWVALLLQTTFAQDGIVVTGGRNLQVSSYTTVVSGDCDDKRVSVSMPIDATALNVTLDGVEHEVPPSRFDLTEQGRYPVRVLPRCKFDDTGVEVLFLMALPADNGPIWSRQSFDMTWSGEIITVGEVRPVDAADLNDWFS